MGLILSFFAIVLLVAADQGIKIWAITVLQEKGTMPFLHIGNWKLFDLTYLENSGAVFGSFSGQRYLLIGVTSVLILVCLAALIRYWKESKWLTVCLILMISGGIGNLIDRIFRHGYVVDYLDFQLFDFAIFNFADCCVVVGIVMFLIDMLFLEKKRSTAKKEDAPHV